MALAGGLLLTFGCIAWIRPPGGNCGRASQVRARLLQLQVQIDLFRLDHGRLPVRLDDLRSAAR